jgi:hypothetical protein
MRGRDEGTTAMPHRSIAIIAFALLSACATRPPEIAVAPPLPPTVIAPPAAPGLPAGASPNMRVPAMLADGSFPTPNRGLTPAATIWHLRAGLNVAALACRADEAAIVARYNGLLAAHKPALAAAESSYAAEFRVGGADWRDHYDDAMTRLYNYYATPPAQAAFCAAAAQVLADAAAVAPGALPAFAAERLPVLDHAFVEFYRKYDAWRRAAMPPVVIASSPPQPRLQLDLRTLSDDRLASAR